MNKEDFEGYLVSTDLACSEKFINILCRNLELSTETLKSNIRYSYKETHTCEVCNASKFELYSYFYNEWTEIFNNHIADELKNRYTVETVSVGICKDCKKWKVKFSRKENKYGYEKVSPLYTEQIV